MKRTILTGLFFALLTFVAAAGFSILKTSEHRGMDIERSNAFDVIKTLDALVNGIMNADAAWDNYRMTGKPEYEEKYDSAIREATWLRDKLKSIYSGTHSSARFDELFILIDGRIQVLDELMVEEAGSKALADVLLREEQINNAFFRAVQQLEKDETAEIVALDAEMEEISRHSIYALLAGTFFSVITFSGLFCLLNRELRQRKRLEQEIKRQAHHDSLTGLPNRLSFMERLDHGVRHAGRSGERLALMFVDLDNFKEINDSLGHEAGDRLLKQVAERLQAGIRESDTVARIGGDEFNVLLTNISGTESVSKIAQKIIGSFTQPFSISGRQVRTSASAGISVYPEDGANPGTLLRNADIAMYQAKEHGRNNFKFFNPSQNDLIQERVRTENEIRRILGKKELVLHYQPRINIRRQQIVSVEALVRWKHPEKGLLYPVQFVPTAESIGFMAELDEWVLRNASAQVKAWGTCGNASLSLTVNLSPGAFKKPGLRGDMAAILAETGFDPRRLELEFPEQAAMDDIEAGAARLRELASLGVQLSIDSSGGGHCLLHDLKKFSLSRIKIDRSFIREIESSRTDRALIRAMTVLAHDAGLSIVGQGVETREQMRFLEEIGCDEAQGYHVCGPLPAEEFGRFAASYRSRAA